MLQASMQIELTSLNLNWFKKIFRGEQPPQISNNSDFWHWFVLNEARFYEVIKNNNDIEKNFIKEFSPVIGQLNERFFFLAGMLDDTTAELIITADGDFTTIPYVEDLIEDAPELSKWKFTAHKTPVGSTISINMSGYEFNDKTISFSINEHKDYPDEIDLSFVYKNFNKEEADVIGNGVLIYLDNYLGEIRSISSIDKIEVVRPDQVQNEVIDIAKLEDYLIWREKEFVEKYSAIRYNTEEDSYASMEATTDDGLPIVAIMNTTLLRWDSKASHPWMIYLDMGYDGSSNNGMPDDQTYNVMSQLEEELLSHLKDHEGYLNLGRETGSNLRTIFLACKDFRMPVRVIDNLKPHYPQLEINMEIFKDKYWLSLNRYINAIK